MVLTRGTNQPGADGVLGTADDVQDATTPTRRGSTRARPTPRTPRTRSSCASTSTTPPRPGRTGKLLSDRADGEAMATWATIKAQAATKLGLQLVDTDVTNIPMIAADPYGNFIPGPQRPAAVRDRRRASSRATSPPPCRRPPTCVRIDTAFLNDIAHNADPAPQHPTTPGDRRTPTRRRTAASTAVAPAGTYDNELLDLHVIAGDGRLQREHRPDRDPPDLPPRARPPDRRHRERPDQRHRRPTRRSTPWPSGSSPPAPTVGHGERLFQAARFVTEMEYQHLVFEEFARKVQPGDQPVRAVRVHPDRRQPGHQSRVRPRRLPVRPLDADRRPSRAINAGRVRTQRHQAARRVPQPGGLLPTAGTGDR